MTGGLAGDAAQCGENFDPQCLQKELGRKGEGGRGGKRQQRKGHVRMEDKARRQPFAETTPASSLILDFGL